MNVVTISCRKCERQIKRTVTEDPTSSSARTTPSVRDLLADWRRQHEEHGEPKLTVESV